VLLAFINPNCSPCQVLLPELADWQRSYAAVLSIAIISTGSVSDNMLKIGDLDLHTFLLQEMDEVATAYRSGATPSAVLISPAGRVHATASGGQDIRHVVGKAILGHEAEVSAAALPLGSEAPHFDLPSMAGKGPSLSVLALRGRMTVVVFWSPSCVFCKELAPDLVRWEAEQIAQAGPRLVVISDGIPTPEDTPFSLVGLDSGDLLRRAYSVTGTPTAVLLDADGRIASPVALGPQEVLDLCRKAAGLAAVARRLSAGSQRIQVTSG
jgi:thiol-disulfide isomerase/thioredoxin